MLISSPSNAGVKRIRSLRNRSAREESGLFFVEGIRIVTEAARAGADIDTIVTAPDLLSSALAREIVRELRSKDIPLLEVTPRVFESISVKENPQGIGASIRQRWRELDEIVPGEETCRVVLEGIADPGNLGTILRTSDAAGGVGVILVGHTTDPYDPSALRASMGAIFAQELVRATIGDLAAWKRQHSLFAVGTSDAAPLGYRDISYPQPLLLWMGSEREGMSPEAQALCDAVVSIPMRGTSDSLNLAVATGIMLYTALEGRMRQA